MEIYLVKPKDCKDPVGTQQNKHQPKIPSLWIIALISTLLYENPVGTQDATTLCACHDLGLGPVINDISKFVAQENPIRISIKLTISSKFWWVPDFQSASLGICILLWISPPGCSAKAAISASVASSANVVVEVVEGLMDKRKQCPGIKDRSELKCQPPKNLWSRMANHPGAVSLGGKQSTSWQTIL